ncbi:response regulator transcription factor [Nonomuraea thailandensis]
MGMWTAGVERWRAGDLEQATSLFHSSLRLERSAGYRNSPAWTVESLAWTAAAQGRDVRAAHLIGAARMMRRLVEVTLEGFHAYHDAHRACESSLRSRLGEENYQKAVEAGATLDFDEAIAFALQESATPRTEPAPVPASAPALAPPFSTLTSRELEVAGLIAEGVRNKDIAARLVISQRTAEGHVEHILEKLGFTSRTQIAAWYVNHVTPPQDE